MAYRMRLTLLATTFVWGGNRVRKFVRRWTRRRMSMLLTSSRFVDHIAAFDLISLNVMSLSSSSTWVGAVGAQFYIFGSLVRSIHQKLLCFSAHSCVVHGLCLWMKNRSNKFRWIIESEKRTQRKFAIKNLLNEIFLLLLLSLSPFFVVVLLCYSERCCCFFCVPFHFLSLRFVSSSRVCIRACAWQPLTLLRIFAMGIRIKRQ